MTFTPTSLAGAYIIEPAVHTDDRGSFFRYFCKEEFRQIGHQAEWVQLNHSITAKKATVRGMHYQQPPHTEIKMIRCIAGTVLDIIVDVRENSPGFLQWFGVELSEKNRKMIYIPEGFAHGFQALSDNCELIYHHSAYYTPGFEAGIRYNDPLVNINWPLEPILLSERDRAHPLISPSFRGIKFS
jgi:dTDP-4-dehydrorhamnose 3,5-epimerase